MDLQDFLSKIDKAGDLVRINRPLSTKYEIAAVMDLIDKSTAQAVLFERVRGHRTPVLGNLLSHRRRLALALGVQSIDPVAIRLSTVAPNSRGGTSSVCAGLLLSRVTSDRFSDSVSVARITLRSRTLVTS